MVKEKDESRLMYIGDSYVSKGLFKGTVYVGGLPRNFDKFLKEIPLFKNLLVPIDGVAEKMEEIKKQDSILFHSNEQLKEYMRGDK